MAAETGGWSLTESDPAVFTAILQEASSDLPLWRPLLIGRFQVGVTGVEVEELWGLDSALLENLK
jgi:hypothetical protein